MLVFSLVSILFSSKLQIQVPRSKLFFDASDAFLFLSILIYGTEVAVFIAFLDSLYKSLRMYYRNKTRAKITTVFANVSVATIGVFISGTVLQYVIPYDYGTLGNVEVTKLVSMLFILTIVTFLESSIYTSIVYSLKTDEKVLSIWKKICFNCLLMYIASAFFAGLIFKAISQIDFILLFTGITVICVVFITYKKYLDELQATAAQVEKFEHERAESEKKRAEQAEKHIEELEHYIAEQDRISHALRESKERFRHSAFHDALTDQPNRNYFAQEVKFMLEKTKITTGFNFAILFLDMNRFKTVNDSLGHSIGDRLIINVAKRLKSIVRKGDMVARFSGDEFAILLNNVKDKEEVSRYAEMIQKKISTPFTINGKQIFTTVSIGIAIGTADYEDSQDLLRDADIAMYRAKEKGESFMFFDPSMHSQTVKLLQLETDLRYAIAREEFCVYYQPIIDLVTMRIKGFEALMRWNHPERGLVPPTEFIPVCEDTGMIIPLTIWILKTACLQVKEWQKRNPENEKLIVSVNLSGRHFSHLNLVEQIWGVLTETDFNPHLLKLEITETAVMENAEQAISVLQELKELGIQLSIDDFGTGYSSLSYLHRFPIDTLKIDRSFVNSMTEGAENGQFVQTIMMLAHTLGLAVIAEGIETINQLHQLRILGCEYGQGYLFSKPIPSQEMDNLLENHSAWNTFVNHSDVLPRVTNPQKNVLRIA